MSLFSKISLLDNEWFKKRKSSKSHFISIERHRILTKKIYPKSPITRSSLRWNAKLKWKRFFLRTYWEQNLTTVIVRFPFFFEKKNEMMIVVQHLDNLRFWRKRMFSCRMTTGKAKKNHWRHFTCVQVNWNKSKEKGKN